MYPDKHNLLSHSPVGPLSISLPDTFTEEMTFQRLPYAPGRDNQSNFSVDKSTHREKLSSFQRICNQVLVNLFPTKWGEAAYRKKPVRQSWELEGERDMVPVVVSSILGIMTIVFLGT